MDNFSCFRFADVDNFMCERRIRHVLEAQKDALDIFDRLEDNLRRLKQNEENVGRDRLRIRFKKAYDRLLNDIRLEANEVVRLMVLGGLIFRNGSGHSEDWPGGADHRPGA